MAENRMELFIETLTGTAFELSCSPLETIVSIKAKIQYSEGIPVSQQHLIWKSQELNDDRCLQDYSINDGATLKLVLGMRGGPINTRQDNKKLKDLSDLVEQTSETAGSEGRPLTVLVFHDGDRVHMYYTLVKKGECAVSPMSGTISETSSVASIKQIEEFDQEVAKEHEITREKVTQLQEQLRALSINRPKRIKKNSVCTPKVKVSSQSKPTSVKEDFHLPPIGRSSAFNNPSTSFAHKNAQAITRTAHRPETSSTGPATPLFSIKEGDNKALDIARHSMESGSENQPALDFVSNNICTCILASPHHEASDCPGNIFNILPNINAPRRSPAMVQRDILSLPTKRSPMIAVNLKAQGLGCLIKHDPSRPKKMPGNPFTSNYALAPSKMVDLDVWLQNRPKTSPGKTKSSFGERLCKAASLEEDNAGTMFKVPESGCERKSGFVMECKAFQNESLSSPQPSLLGRCTFENAHSLRQMALGSIVSSIKALNEPEKIEDLEDSGIKKSTKHIDESSIAFSSNKLPLIKPKKKSYKRCFQCSRKTGLATSYTCRCGKNFCASHRYAEVHQCSYDYKTEGRRLLQLNNPVVKASKLPKI